ncbi:MAG: hypothetical protein HY063_11425 [Bacteroidetes bacterium]|nr:hypothetical protein [Bacteroidota bacterium]
MTTEITLGQTINSDSSSNQNDTNPKYFWGQGGILMGGRLGYQLGANYNQDKHFFSARYYQNKEMFVGFPFPEPELNTIQWIKNFSLLYGQSFSNKYFKFIPMAGLSFGQGNWRNSYVDTIQPSSNSGWGPNLFPQQGYVYHYDNFQYLGVIADLNFIWTPSKYFGFAIDIFQNFHLHSDRGFAVSIILGHFKK